LFLPESAKVCQHHFEQTLRGTGSVATGWADLYNAIAIIEFCNLHQKKIDTAAQFHLEQGRFRCPFAEQNKKTGIIRLRQGRAKD